ncbi:MAG TPA: hypothetical protein VGF67_27870 [Ktedonobacteraceae bacterium]|jgi:hypothetical protein
MLLAVDIDGTIATITGTGAYGAYVHRVLGIPIDPAWRHLPSDPSLIAALCRETSFLAWWKAHPDHHKRVQALLDDGQYSQEVQERSRPIPGAQEALSQLAGNHHILYVTNRKSTTLTLTQSWLKKYGFPSYQNVCCCGEEQGFVSKVRYAVATLQAIDGEGGQIVFIDDKAPYFEHTFAALVREDLSFVKGCIHRVAAIAYGKGDLPACRFPRPVFPMAPMLEWACISDTLSVLTPCIGGAASLFDHFFDETFVPVLLRRRRNPRIPQNALSA